MHPSPWVGNNTTTPNCVVSSDPTRPQHNAFNKEIYSVLILVGCIEPGSEFCIKPGISEFPFSCVWKPALAGFRYAHIGTLVLS